MLRKTNSVLERKINYCLKKNKMVMNDLLFEMGMSRQTFHNKRKKGNFTMFDLKRMALALNVQTFWLLEPTFEEERYFGVEDDEDF